MAASHALDAIALQGGAAPHDAAGRERILSVAFALTGAPALGLAQVGGGRNSRVFRVDTPNGPVALKEYPSRLDDPRDRQGTEAKALGWMAAQGFAEVPRVIATDRESNFTALSWVEGELVRDVGEADIDAALVFLARIHHARNKADIAPGHLAAGACLSGAEIERQVQERRGQLETLRSEPALLGFLADKFAPAAETLFRQARAARRGRSPAFDQELPQTRRSLVPADFGFHNALRHQDGALTFIDFEYFGWDDPVKLTSDLLVHPGTPLPADLQIRFRQGAERLFGNDRDFARRLAVFQPLFGLRWVLIVLNEFHPERWRRRVLAGAHEAWAEGKRRQLQIARAMLEQLTG